jgi:hypothetical protein
MEPRFRFTDPEQHALRLTGRRVTPAQADRAWRGEIVATVKATGRWSVVEKGETVAIGAGENPVASALAALTAAATLRARRINAQLA